MNGTGFVTVVGAGLSADVRLIKKESVGSLFQWQDMLHGQCMLLSLKTNRYVGLDRLPENLMLQTGLAVHPVVEMELYLTGTK